MRYLSILAASFLFVPPAFCQNTKDDQTYEINYAKSILQEKNIKTDGPSLVRFFEQRIPSVKEQEQIQNWVQRLGHDSYKVRAKAMGLLFQAGQGALPFLKVGLTHEDEEIIRRSSLCWQQVLAREQATSPQVLAAAQLLAHLKPAGATQALLGYLPFVQDSGVVEQIRRSLKQVASPQDKAQAVVLAALKDKFPIRRAIAGELLVKMVENAPTATLLKDPDPLVRFHVAQALVYKKKHTAIPVVISVLDQLPPDKAWQAEDLLFRIATENAPDVSLGGIESARDVRVAWQKWWQTNQTKVQLAKLTENPTYLGYTVISQMDPRRGVNGQILEIDQKGRERWKISGVRYPLDVQVIGPNRVMVAEYTNRCVTVRDFNGKVVSRLQASQPVCCKRLPNGNTFIVSRNEIVEYNGAGKKVFTYQPNPTITAACKTRDGHIVVIDSRRQCQWLDANKRVVKTFQAGPVYTMGGKIEALANGNILVPEYAQNRVVEYTPAGKVAWKADLRFPTAVTRLSNGNTLAVSMTDQKIVEFNRAGREVWHHRTTSRPWSASRR